MDTPRVEQVMTKLQAAITLLEGYKRSTEAQDEQELLQLAIDTLSVRRVFTWLCEDCKQPVDCHYLRYDPSPYRVKCSHCPALYRFQPTMNDYGLSDVQRVKGATSE